jgi:single-stranded-DNA-specific exonuclease
MKIKRRPLPQSVVSWQSCPPLIQKLYLGRGITEEVDTQIELTHLLSYQSLLNIDKASERLSDAVMHQQHILVIGDFDADGATASALAVSALRAMGAQHANFLVPNRFAYGYGLTVGIVEQAALLKPDLIVTVDNGISNIEGVARAKQLGMDVLITDHHLAGEILPQADVIINPNQPHDTFPSKSIAGVGVIFYVMSALRQALKTRSWFDNQQIKVPNMAQFLDLVALGTVADVVSLDRNNRILVKHGLSRIQKGYARPGIDALIRISGRSRTTLKSSDLGFALAPRLNAAGRLDDMSLGIHCLLADSLQQALPMAQRLDELNLERRQIESDMQGQAVVYLQDLYGSWNLESKQLPPTICLYDESWHQGVIGILAGRLKDKFKKPSIIFARGDADELKGSARSINGINIRDVLASIDLKYPHLLKKFGGHAMAAGLSVLQSHLEHFKQAFKDEIELLNIEPETDIWTDGGLEPDDFSLSTAQMIQQFGPWGQTFPEPSFDNVFLLIDQRIVGQNHLKLTLQPINGKQFIDAIAFNIDVEKWPNYRATHIQLIYQLDINEYQGRQRLQLIIQGMEPFDESRLSTVNVEENVNEVP